MKRFFVALILSSFVFSTISSAQMLESASSFENQNKNPIFSDLDEYHPNFYAINWMNRNAVVSGYSNGTFKPDDCVNRVEFLKMLFEVLDEKTDYYSSELFSDTKEGEWYIPYVKTARALGVINGYNDGTFRPGQCVSRAEANKMALLSYYSLSEIESIDYVPEWYVDLKPEDWYYKYVGFSFNRSFWSDNDGEELGANKGMTRAEVAELLYRLKSVKDNGRVYYSWDEPLDINDKPFYEKCDYKFATNFSDSSYLNVYPEDLDLFMSLNYGEDGNRKQFEEMLAKFPEIGFFDLLVSSSSYNTRPEHNFWLLSEDLFADDYELSMGMKFPSGEVDFMTMGEASVVVSGMVKDGSKFYSVLEKTLALNYLNEMSCEIDGDFLFWTAASDDFYMVRYGNIFFLTNTEQNRDDSVSRLKKKLQNSHREEVSTNLAYMFANGKIFSEIMEMTYGSDAMSGLLSFYEQMGDLKFSIKADSATVLRMDSSLEFNDDLYLDKYRNKNISLLNKIPGKNLIAYVEDLNFGMLASPYASMLDLTVNSGAGSWLERASEELGLNDTEFLKMIDNSYAFSFSDVGEFYPGMVFALSVDNVSSDSLKNMVSAIDLKVEDFISDVALETKSIELRNYIEKQNLSDGNLKRIKLDMNKMPETFWEGESLSEERKLIGNTVFDLWYGVMNVNGSKEFVIALYPEFLNAYGNNVVSANADFKEALSTLGGNYNSTISYISVSKLMNYVENIMQYNGTFALMGEDYEDFQKWITTFDYIVSGSGVSLNKLVGKGIVKLK